jgi:thioredoxin-like negative regulator of GroEL
VDIDELGSIADAGDVKGVPTFKFFKAGSLVHEFSGANQQTLDNALASYK